MHYLTYLMRRDKTILTVHDLVSMARLRGIRRLIFWFLWLWLPVRRVAAIVVVSESTRQELLATVRCKPGLVHVIHNPVSKAFSPRAYPAGLDIPRILQIGTTSNKNLPRVAEAVSGIKCRLVIVGTLTTDQLEALDRFRVDYENHVGLSEEALLDQYERAALVLFASTYEGFGLPIAESNAVGRPVVTSNLSSMPEIAGDAACYVDPWRHDSIRAGVLRVLGDAEYRESLVEAGYANAARFRAALIAEQYASLYRSLARGTP